MEWAASRIPPLPEALSASLSPSPLASPKAASPFPLQHVKPGLAAELLSLAKALEQVEAQRQKILEKSTSQPLTPVAAVSNTVTSLKRVSAVDERAAIRQRHVTTDPRFFQDLLLCECGEELHPADRKLHVDTECPLRMVQCARPGCNQLFQANQKLQHDQLECLVAHHSRKLLQAKADGNALVECDICHDQQVSIHKRDLQRHQLYMCVKRVVSCRFAEWGCTGKFPSDEQEAHEAHGCVVTKRREQIASDALLVNEETECDWCKQVVKKRHLLDHQEDECLERERPCPNAVNGCKEWVPVGKFDEHIRTNCSVTMERNVLVARAREKNTAVVCKECGLTLKLRHLSRHWREECVSRIVSCKNVAHGCKARLRWRDRHLHEDFMALSRDRSALQFQTGGRSYIAVQGGSTSTNSGGSGDLAPPWTAEYFVWMVDADEEILDLLKSSLVQLETQVVNARENQRWLAKSEACKKRLKELKQLRKRKSPGSGNSVNSNQKEPHQKPKLTGAELSATAKDLADEFNASETGALATQKAVNLAKGWVQIFLTEALRIFNDQKFDKRQEDELRSAIAMQTAQVLQERPVLVEILSEAELGMLSDLETWAHTVASDTNSRSSSSGDSVERQQKLAELKKLLKKRSEWQDLLAGLASEATDSNDKDAQAQAAETERLRRRYERELGKVDAKLAIVSENTPTELLERRGRHVIASSNKNAISLVAGTRGHVTFYRSSLPSTSKAVREVQLDCQLPRNQWHHVALSASKKELSLFLNGELKAIKRGVFDLPLGFIGAHETNDNGTSSFQGFVQEIRYWKECRSAKQLQQSANTILHVPKCRERLVAYWTLEEGMGELVDDMALLLPRSPCFNTNWVLYDTPAIHKRFGIPPTPSLRDKTCCIVNQKLKALAQRARDRERDVVSCRQHCEETEIPLQQLDAHHRLLCKNRMVVCKEIGCGQVHRFADELQHLSASCERHLFREKLFRRYQEKEELESCLLNCGLTFKKRASEHHYHSECANRLVMCPRLDCQGTIVAKTLAVHLAKDCRSQEHAAERKMVENARKRQKEKQQQFLRKSHGQGQQLPSVAIDASQSTPK